MKSSLLPLITGVVFVAALECGAAKADMPDCVGIRPGMPVAEARELLKAYDSKLEVRAIELQIPELSEKPVLERLFVVRNSMPRRNTNGPAPPGSVTTPRLPLRPSPPTDPVETLQVAITLPPNKPAVWKVVRSLRFEAGEEKTRAALFTALAEKYGKESLAIEQGFGKISRYWVRDAQGNLLEGQAAKECSSYCQSYQTSMDAVLSRGINTEFSGRLATILYLSGIEQMAPAGASRKPGVDPRTELQDGPQCQTLTQVIAELSVGVNRDLVNELQITVVDAGLDTRAREATRALIKQSEAAKEQQRVEKARQQQIPKL